MAKLRIIYINRFPFSIFPLNRAYHLFSSSIFQQGINFSLGDSFGWYCCCVFNKYCLVCWYLGSFWSPKSDFIRLLSWLVEIRAWETLRVVSWLHRSSLKRWLDWCLWYIPHLRSHISVKLQFNLISHRKLVIWLSSVSLAKNIMIEIWGRAGWRLWGTHNWQFYWRRGTVMWWMGNLNLWNPMTGCYCCLIYSLMGVLRLSFKRWGGEAGKMSDWSRILLFSWLKIECTQIDDFKIGPVLMAKSVDLG